MRVLMLLMVAAFIALLGRWLLLWAWLLPTREFILGASGCVAFVFGGALLTVSLGFVVIALIVAVDGAMAKEER